MRLLVGADRIALAGSLERIGDHSHAAPAVVVGVDGHLCFVADRSHRSRAALIAPGFAHAVDVAKSRIAVFLLPPHAVARGRLPEIVDLPAPGAWVELAQSLLAGRVLDFEPVDRLVSRASLNARPIDPRLHAGLAALWATLDENLPVDELAAAARLSSSHFMSLAREHMGTSLRRYRRWLRMFRVARDYSAGSSLTTAALAAGFASSAHLSAAAREHFGIQPSQIHSRRFRAGIKAI